MGVENIRAVFKSVFFVLSSLCIGLVMCVGDEDVKMTEAIPGLMVIILMSISSFLYERLEAYNSVKNLFLQ